MVALLALMAAGTEARPKLPKKKVIQDLATRWFKARPKTKFERWNHATRDKLLEEARALGPVPEGSREAVIEMLWKVVKKHGPKAKKDEIQTPYGRAWWIRSGSGKKGFLLGLHGGGEGAGSASEATSWKLPGMLGFYPQGIRLIHDTWNSVHGERFILTMIEIAKAQYNVDPDRVFMMGFSMGGNGSMFHAGRNPDLLAGAIPAHGVVTAAGGTKVVLEKDVGELEHGLLPNMRNVAVYFYTGSEDENCEPGTFRKAWTTLQELKKNDRGGYEEIRFTCHEGIKHSQPPGEPGKAYKYIKDKRRNAYPTKIVWEYNEDPWIQAGAEDEGKADRLQKEWMYWLHCKAPRDRMYITVTRSETEKEHVIDLEFTLVFADDFTIYLNEKMYDVKKDVVVRVDGKEVYRGKPQPDFATILESLDSRLDRTLTFDRKIPIPEMD